MERIIIHKEGGPQKKRRATVVVRPETYEKIYNLALEANVAIETITNILLEEALKYVEVK